MLGPAFLKDDESTLGLVKKLVDNWRVSFIARVTFFDAQKQTVDVTPVTTEPTYLPSGVVSNMKWPPIKDVPVTTIGYGSWQLTMPVEVGSDVLIVCTDLDFRQWYKRNQVTNKGNKEYHTLNNAIAVAGIKTSLNPIPNYSITGPEIRNVNGQFSLSITEESMQLKIGGKLSLDITGDNVIINIAGTPIATVTSSGITMDSVDLTIQGTKIFEWLTTHTHGYVSPAGPAITDPAGPQ